ncbi:MAG: LLM class flavin-dependent oxidoreductase [Candidatus Limnocylindrales bacterium]|jgi:alkanesulfonate monooxygenase SsuD/methylene tetrahydromethanopterin reductase-like flavin-dependent oxidoreductase (luciferase family)
MQEFKVGINLWSQAGTWPELLDAARLVDRLGFEHLWTWDHVKAIVGDPNQPIHEGWTTITAWAMATQKVKIGLMVGANTFRNPALVAKIVTTFDHVSGGRAILGIGGAWFELEHREFGIEFGTGHGQRLDWLDESVGAIRSLLSGRSVTSPAGGHYAFDDLTINPLPVQKRLPILIGGNGRTKTLRTLARYGDMWNAFGLPAEVRELDGVLRRHCEEAGRDEREIERSINLWVVVRDSEAEARRDWASWMELNRTAIERTLEPSRPLFGTPEAIAARLLEYCDAGFTTAIVEMPAPYDRETLERLAREVRPMVAKKPV